MTKTLRFINGQVFENREFRSKPLYVSNGKIQTAAHGDIIDIDCKGGLIVPGFIDLQINGAFGVDFTSNPDKASHVAKKLPQYGVTSFLMTIITQGLEKYATYAEIVKNYSSKGADLLGLHLEGPHISFEKCGAHNPEYILQPCATTFWERFFTQHKVVKMMTLAPEVAKAFDLIEIATKLNIVTSCGHSMASYSDMEDAYDAGLTMVTHLYNAMKPLESRAPGPIGFTLSTKKPYYSILSDGIHVDPAVIELTHNAYPDGAILVSDANALLGIETVDIKFLGDQKIEKIGEECFIAGTKTLAGGATSLPEMIYRYMKFTGCSLGEALLTVTERPADLLGLKESKGYLEAGCDADIVIIDPNTEEKIIILKTYVGGELVYEKIEHSY